MKDNTNDNAEQASQVDESLAPGGEPSEHEPTQGAKDTSLNTSPAKDSANKGTESEKDFKTLYEQAERRRQGLDRRISQLRQSMQQLQNSQEGGESDAELNRLRLFEAEVKLKSEAQSIIDQYGDRIPKGIAAQITKNPRGFIKPTTETLEEAIFDLEDYISELADNVSVNDANNQSGKQPSMKVASLNATVSPSSDVDMSSLDTPEKVEAAIKDGKITEMEYENHIRSLAQERSNKNI